MEKQLIIGLDLSFLSTGITIAYLEDAVGKKIEFTRLVYEKKPHDIKNINQETYLFPTNISLSDLLIVDDDEGENEDGLSEEQAEITLRAMICAKRIHLIIEKAIAKYNPDSLFFEIENFIMPSFTGKNQMKGITGLIMLQGFIRSNIIRLKLDKKRNFNRVMLFVVSPTALKKFFANNGRAEKPDMERAFYDNFEGVKLLPERKGKLDDVIDSFALMYHCYVRLMRNPNLLLNNNNPDDICAQ